ncbi:MAG: gliding motility-associated C-terminal domain-containing protein [Candidatus Latescibacterota bacterium]|jgi:hypothetical protein
MRLPKSCLLVALFLCSGARTEAQFTHFSLPGDLSWKAAQLAPFDTVNYYESVAFGLRADGVAPLDTVLVVPVPLFADTATVAGFSRNELRTYTGFYRNVARDSVFARQAVAVDGQTLVQQGELLLPALADFPRDLARIRLLRQAGVDSIRAMVNLVTSVLWRRNPEERFVTVLRTPTIYERQLNNRQKRDLLEALIDSDPTTAFYRIDATNRNVEKRAVVILMDLVWRFPIGLIRFYCRPLDNPIRISAYGLEAFDGVTYKRGQDVDLATTGSRLPQYDQLLMDQANVKDTVSVVYPKPKYLQSFKFRSLTGLDFDIAEFEAYNQGYRPSATFTSKPLPVDKSAIPVMMAYLNGDLTKRAQLDRLQGGTLGRIYWEEEKLGDPSKSSAEVTIQTGRTPEPLLLFRLNLNGDIVVWRPNATVVDRRVGSKTLDQSVNLDDPLLRIGARDIWNALSDAERAAAQTTYSEFVDPLIVPPINRKDRSSEPLPKLPDAVLWSGFQPVRNGQLITVPSERPFFQLKVDFKSAAPDAATVVRNLYFEQLFPPALQEVRAEIVPAAEVAAGADTVFTYALRPRMLAADAGFNRIRVTTPTVIERLEKVELGYGLSGLVRRQTLEAELLARTDSFFVVGLPSTIKPATARGDSLVVLVEFRGRVLDAKTTFAGAVFLDEAGPRDRTDYSGLVIPMTDDPLTGRVDTLAQILPQQVVEGNVLPFGGGGDRNTLSVVTSVADDIQRVVERLEVSPKAFTPNGDGINDQAEISFDLLRVVVPVPVSVEVYDLAGRRVWQATRAAKISSYLERWNGMNQDGTLVPPGVYLVKVTAETDAGDIVATRLVAVAY